MEFVGLVGGSGQDDQFPLRCITAPSLQLLEPVAPVPTASQQSNHNQPSRLGSGVEVVVQLSWVFETTQGQRANPLVPGRGEWKAGVEAADICAGAGQEQHICAWLLDEHHVFGWVQTRTGGKTMHGSILRLVVPGGEKIQRSDSSR